MNIEWGFYFLLAMINAFAATLIFFSALYFRTSRFPVWYKVALIMTGLGFAAQAALSIPYLLFGRKIYMDALPLWLLNDIGIAILICHYFWHYMIKKYK